MRLYRSSRAVRLMAMLQCRKIRHPIQGQARKVALTFLILSTLGWTVFVVFLGLTTLETTVKSSTCTIPKSRIDGTFAPYWCFLVAGPILYMLAAVALFVNRGGYLQTIINFFAAVYFICGGAIMYTYWIVYGGGVLKFSFEFGACCTSVITTVLYMLTVPHFKSQTNSLHKQSDLNLDTINCTSVELTSHHESNKMSLEINTETCNSKPGQQEGENNPSEQKKTITNTPPVQKDDANGINQNENEYVQPNEVNISDGANDEADYVINEPFYEDYQENTHIDEVYEDMADVIYDN